MKLHSLPALEEFQYGAFHRGPDERCDICCVAGFARKVVEEELNRDTECLADLIEAACANAVRCFFIFLHLLKSQAKLFAKRLLAHTYEDATQLDTPSDMDVDGVSAFRAGYRRFVLQEG